MKRGQLAEPSADPFAERHRLALHRRMRLLGGDFHFETDSPQLIRIIEQAYAHLPAHRLGSRALPLRVRMLLTQQVRPHAGRQEPPLLLPLAAPGLLCGALAGSSFAAMVPEQRSALITVPRSLLRFPYHLRYELLEFAVYMLAARVQRLTPLHAACVGRGGRGLLLLGPSGAGKSTLALQCLLQGFEFLAEDSVLVKPSGLLATGVANFIHVRRDSLRFLASARLARELGRATLIRRRSGVRKLEIDLRHQRFSLARAPLKLAALLFVSPRTARDGRALRPLGASEAAARLVAEQPYAAAQPGWSAFRNAVTALPAFELQRTGHPQQAVAALESLLDGPAL
jgi:hypothetical protein